MTEEWRLTASWQIVWGWRPRHQQLKTLRKKFPAHHANYRLRNIHDRESPSFKYHHKSTLIALVIQEIIR